MATATDEHLREVRRRIDRLEAKAKLGTADAKSRMQRYIDTLRRDEESARASTRERTAAVDEPLEQLDNELELAEHRVAAEFATTEDQFTDALEGGTAPVGRVPGPDAGEGRGGDRGRARAG